MNESHAKRFLASRALAVLGKKRITDNTLHSITANLARVLTKRCALLRVCCEAVTVVGLWLVSCLTPTALGCVEGQRVDAVSQWKC